MNKKNKKLDIEDSKAIKYIYSKSASIFSDMPEGIFYPKNKKDIKEIIRYAKNNNLSILPKGAGTSRSGQDVNRSIVVDLTKYFNKILDFDDKNNILKVQSGVTLKEINKFVNDKGLFFPPDPSSGDYCTIGGMLGNNSGGARALKYGVMRDYVTSVEVVLSDETIYSFPKDNQNKKFDKLRDILLNNKKTIENYYPKTIKNSSGYNLKGIFEANQGQGTALFEASPNPLLKEEANVDSDLKPLGNLGAPTFKNVRYIDPLHNQGQGTAMPLQKGFGDKNLNLTPLFTSSEGTLGIVTEIEIKVLPILKYRENFILTANSLTEVIELVTDVKRYHPEKIELVDKDILRLAKLNDAFIDKIINSNYQYILLISFSSKDKNLLKSLVNLTEKIKNNLLKVENEKEYDKMFRLRKTAAGYIHRTRERGKPIPVIEDLQVDFSKFELFTNGIKAILGKYNINAFFFGHIGDGNIHINTFFDILKKDDRKLANILRREVHRFIISIDGSLTGEHGDGKLRSIDLENIYPKLYPIFKDIKSFFDYDNIFNPNNLIIVDKTINPFDNLRLNLLEKYNVPKELNDYFYVSEIEACNGCGKCRDYCPSFKANSDERYTTRARLTLFQGLIGGDLDLDDFRKGQNNGVRDIIDSCIGCHICASECPTGVDAGKLIFKLKTILDENSSIKNKIIKENDLIGVLGQKTSPISNILLNSKIGKQINEKVLGIDQSIILPKFRKNRININDYLISENQLDSLPKNSVIYFSGCFANYYSTDSEFYSTIKVLEFFNFKPYLINFKCCGISKINSGISIKDDADINVKLFNKITKYNIPIIFTSPSCQESVVELYPFLNRKWAKLDYFNNIYDIFTFLRKNLEHKGIQLQDNKLINKRAKKLKENLNEEFSDLNSQNSSRKESSISKEFTTVNDVKSTLLTTKYEENLNLNVNDVKSTLLTTKYEENLNLSLQHHEACHSRGTTTSKDVKFILERFGYNIELLPQSCCGMAGTFGTFTKNIEKSLKIGKSQLDLIDENKKDVITGCGTCQIQINSHTSQNVDHPIKYLYEAILKKNNI